MTWQEMLIGVLVLNFFQEIINQMRLYYIFVFIVSTIVYILIEKIFPLLDHNQMAMISGGVFILLFLFIFPFFAFKDKKKKPKT